jgi:hypothetical protein
MNIHYIPKPRGWMNPAMKDASVRGVSTEETRLFDSFDAQGIPPAAYELRESLVDLRDLQYALRDHQTTLYRWKREDVSIAIMLAREICAHYLNIMHPTDSSSLAPKVFHILKDTVNLEQLNEDLTAITSMIDTMCKVNVSVISLALRGKEQRMQK